LEFVTEVLPNINLAIEATFNHSFGKLLDPGERSLSPMMTPFKPQKK
jgi:hypothetical protein